MPGASPVHCSSNFTSANVLGHPGAVATAMNLEKRFALIFTNVLSAWLFRLAFPM